MAELPEGRIAANGLVFPTLEAGLKDGPPVSCLHGSPDPAARRDQPGRESRVACRAVAGGHRYRRLPVSGLKIGTFASVAM